MIYDRFVQNHEKGYASLWPVQVRILYDGKLNLDKQFLEATGYELRDTYQQTVEP